MLESLVGKKIGMTQVFDKMRCAVPVTVIDIGRWFVTQVKTNEKDGYASLQIGKPKDKLHDVPFSMDWLKAKKKFFSHLKEIPLIEEDAEAFNVGQQIALDDSCFQEDMPVFVTGVSTGKGFQGVVKRWNFAGGPSSHGSTFHRKPGSIGNICSQGKVVKGKKLPGHTGNKRFTAKGLKVVRVDKQAGCIFVYGAVPGRKNSLVIIHKQG
jgi:large subunit ribosomal protein L3